MGLPETPRAGLFVLLEPVREVGLGMEAQPGRDRLDRDFRCAEALFGVSDAPSIEITAGSEMKLCIKKPVELRDSDACFASDELAIPSDKRQEKISFISDQGRPLRYFFRSG